MSEKKKRASHSPEFKAKVGLEAIRSDKTVNEIGLSYGIHPSQVNLWKKAIQDQVRAYLRENEGPPHLQSTGNRNGFTAKLVN